MADIHSDIELLLLWKQGDDKAFEAIYKRYAVKLLGIAMQKTGNREVAEEIVQDTFLAMFNKKTSIGELTSVIAFLYVILKNKIMDKYRHDLIERRHENYLLHVFDEADNSTQAIIETRELEQLLSVEIEKLPQRCRNVFNLSRGQFLTNKEIAVRLCISENTVEQHMRKALRILRGSILHNIRCFFL